MDPVTDDEHFCHAPCMIIFQGLPVDGLIEYQACRELHASQNQKNNCHMNGETAGIERRNDPLPFVYRLIRSSPEPWHQFRYTVFG